MSWTRSIPPAAAAAELDTLYRRIAASSSTQSVAHVWQATGPDPAGLAAAHALYAALMGEPAPLTRAQAEMIAVVVSATNGCGYCVAHHGPKLAGALGDDALAHAVALDYREANLAARDRVLLDYAVALTCEPGERKLEDVERLREYGFDDPAILRATEVTAYYNYTNRVVSALGVALEPGRTPWEFGAQK